MIGLFTNVHYQGLVEFLTVLIFVLSLVVFVFGLWFILKKPSGQKKSEFVGSKLFVYLSITIAPLMLILLAIALVE